MKQKNTVGKQAMHRTHQFRTSTRNVKHENIIVMRLQLCTQKPGIQGKQCNTTHVWLNTYFHTYYQFFFKTMVKLVTCLFCTFCSDLQDKAQPKILNTCMYLCSIMSIIQQVNKCIISILCNTSSKIRRQEFVEMHLNFNCYLYLAKFTQPNITS